MDIFDNTQQSRNGVEDAYENFLGIGNGKKRANAADVQMEAILQKYPPQSTAADQQVMITALQAESASVLAQRNSAKGKTRTELTGKLRAYDSYYADAKTRLANLQASEKAAADAAAISTPVTGTAAAGSMLQTVVAPSASGQGTPAPAAKKTNWLMLGGIAAAAIGLIMFLRKKN